MTKTSRYLWTAGAVAAVLAVSLIVGGQLNERQQTAANPSASPTRLQTSVPIEVRSSPTANPNVTPTAASSPPSSAIYNDDFGFMVNEASTTVPSVSPGAPAAVRTESSNTRIASFQHQYFAVSPDGTQVAYWTVQSPGQSSRLQIDSVTNPKGSGASSGLSPGESGAIIIWASDSSGVAYTVLGAGPTTTSTIRTFNARPGTSGAGQVVITSNGYVVPIAWDRASNILAAGVSGDGGFITEYIVASTATPQAAPKRTAVAGRMPIGSVSPSSDAKLLVGVDLDAGFSYWPLSDYGAKVTPAESTYGQNGAVWRPGTHEIGFIGPSNQFWLCDADRNTPLGCGRTAFSGVPTGATVRLFRVDGSAVLLAVPGTAGAPTAYTLVKLSNDPLAAKATGGDRVTFADLSGIKASVRLR